MRKVLPLLVLGSGTVLYLAACSSDSTGPKHTGTCTGTAFTVAALQGRVISQADLPCLSIPADGGTYLIVPQFATASSPVTPVSFTLAAAAPGAATASMVSASRRAMPLSVGATADLGQMQRRFEGMLRRQEREVAASARASGTAMGPLASRVQASAVPPA
ncbi:MAG: hypothetical protein JJD97_08340, partial [Gemmatimonadaceae bacterium]|nr:hypothetical protein [Gemmatimonadaceae bacterium]